MPHRLSLIVVALLTAAGCSTASAEVTSNRADDATTTEAELDDATTTTERDDSTTTEAERSTTTERDATTTTETERSTTTERDEATTETERGDGTTTTDAERRGWTRTERAAIKPSTSESTADETTTTTEATTTTTTTEPIEPVRLPEREIVQVSAAATPLEPAGTSSGDAMEIAQRRLLELGFWLDEPGGSYDNTTQQAVMAFQKYYGLEPDGVMGPITAEAMSEVSERPQGLSTTGTLVEVDKSKQLVFIVADGVVQWVLNTSTGTEVPYSEINKNTGQPERGDSVTRTGLFAVERERAEGWWAGDLGEIYRPKYFDGGIALHGSNYIPAYPASHGCVRLSTDAMDWIWDNEIVPRGTTVWVHGEIPD